MSKQYNIRWKQSDLLELKKTVRNFNAKIKRLESKDPANRNALPEKVSMKELKELIHTRVDLNREINALKRFSKRGAEKIVTAPGTDYTLNITKWQKTEMNRMKGIVNRKRKKRLEQIKALDQTASGQMQGYKVQMGKAEELALRPVNAFTPKMTRHDLKAKYKSLKKESQSNFFDDKDKKLKDNYIKGIHEHYSSYKNVEQLIDKIQKMPMKQFLKMFQSEGGTFEISSPIQGVEINMDAYFESLMSTWMPNKK